MKVEIFGSTDVGQVRDHNEDNFVLCKDLTNQDWTYKRDEQFDLGKLGAVLFVADGMGGANAGEVASDMAQASIEAEFRKITALPGDDQAILSFIKKIIVKAHQTIVQHTMEDPTTAGMGTTAVVCWIVNDKAYVAWSGDSRMYLYRDGADFYPITDDHSIVWELVKNGQLTTEEARLHENSNIITQSLGDESRAPKPDAKMVPLQKGDRVMLCSDGLNGMVSDNMLGGILSGRLSTAETCKELIHAANAAGGTDNITVLMLDVLDGVKGKPVAGSSSNVVTAASRGGTPINTVASKSGTNKGVIAGIVIVLVIIAAVFFLLTKPGSGEVVIDDKDTLANPIDTTLIDTPIEDQSNEPTTIPVDEPANNNTTTNTPSGNNTTVTSTPNQSNTPSNANQPPANNAPSPNDQPPVTDGEKPDEPADNNTTKTITPKDTADLPGGKIKQPNDTVKNGAPGSITPRKPGPGLPPGGLNPDRGI